MFWKIQEICNKMGTRICKIVEEMAEIIEPKVGNPKNSVSRNWAILSYPWNLIFLMMRFSNFFLNYMVWKYQNEIAPIFYYGISTKTNEKDLKIPNLQSPDRKNPYWMSLYEDPLRESTSSLMTCPFLGGFSCLSWASIMCNWEHFATEENGMRWEEITHWWFMGTE